MRIRPIRAPWSDPYQAIEKISNPESDFQSVRSDFFSQSIQIKDNTVLHFSFDLDPNIESKLRSHRISIDKI